MICGQTLAFEKVTNYRYLIVSVNTSSRPTMVYLSVTYVLYYTHTTRTDSPHMSVYVLHMQEHSYKFVREILCR